MLFKQLQHNFFTINRQCAIGNLTTGTMGDVVSSLQGQRILCPFIFPFNGLFSLFAASSIAGTSKHLFQHINSSNRVKLPPLSITEANFTLFYLKA